MLIRLNLAQHALHIHRELADLRRGEYDIRADIAAHKPRDMAYGGVDPR